MDLRSVLLDFDRAYDVPTALAGAADAAPLRLPATPLACLGDRRFREIHQIKFPYMAGAMANGIASVELVEALGQAGFLGIYGAAGQALAQVERAVERLERSAPAPAALPYGCNLIHSPSEPELEDAVAKLYIRRGVRLVEASAYLQLTLPIVRYRVHGIHRTPDGRVIAPNRVIAKVSRVEVATPFLSPPPAPMLAALVAEGALTAEEARWAATLPMAEDLTAEADSGGHTDNRPALALLPTMLALRDRLQEQYGYAEPPRVGAAGGIATPAAAAAAFAMGAAYVVTGSINQACVGSGASDLVRQMLAEAEQADVAMAPAADMFEMGVKVQVLKRGTMFPMRATKLAEAYSKYRTLDDIPDAERATLEKQLFRAPLTAVWASTRAYFAARDPRQVERAERDPRHLMALVFRSYLGQSSHWANQGLVDRRFDFQVWCGPAMGAFNAWVKGSFLETPAARRAPNIALNILYGAALLGRAQILRSQGADARRLDARWQPLPDEALWTLLERGPGEA
jgi:trans-AT polyketide synthase/acyltransferase/oxidoreductase domain-containing protein